jgi:hypothetical protein
MLKQSAHTHKDQMLKQKDKPFFPRTRLFVSELNAQKQYLLAFISSLI